jgi:hypothetical protein
MLPLHDEPGHAGAACRAPGHAHLPCYISCLLSKIKKSVLGNGAASQVLGNYEAALPHRAQVLLNQVSLRAADRAVLELRRTLGEEEKGAAAKAVAAAADERRARQVNAFTDCMG